MTAVSAEAHRYVRQLFGSSDHTEDQCNRKHIVPAEGSIPTPPRISSESYARNFARRLFGDFTDPALPEELS